MTTDRQSEGLKVLVMQEVKKQAKQQTVYIQLILYWTEEEKHQFVQDSFKLDKNKILNTNNTLKEALIQLLVDNFEFLATHPSQYSETED